MAIGELKKRIVLASASPRRREILEQMGVDFEVVVADTDEICSLSDPIQLTPELARRKGEAVARMLNDDSVAVISADTVVYVGEEIFGKPDSREDAERMLRAISGKAHSVITGVAVTLNGKTSTAYSRTQVVVDTIPPEQIRKYIDSNDCFDKAGAYGIQGMFSTWVKEIQGCYFGVVGLSPNTVARLFCECVGCYPNEYK